MAFSCGFFDSVDGDRRYNSRQISQLFDGLIVDGVFAHYGTHFEITPFSSALVGSSLLGVVIGSGRFWFNHVWGLNDGNIRLTLDPSDIAQPRIDAIVIDVDSNDGVRNAFITFVKGSPGGTKPSLIKTEKRNQYPLAYVTIPANATSISAGNIEVKVGTSECPFSTGVLESVNIDNLYAQWDSQFKTWFNESKELFNNQVADWDSEFTTLFNTVKNTFDTSLEGWDSEFHTWFQSIKDVMGDDVVTNFASQIKDLQDNKADKTEIGSQILIDGKAYNYLTYSGLEVPEPKLEDKKEFIFGAYNSSQNQPYFVISTPIMMNDGGICLLSKSNSRNSSKYNDICKIVYTYDGANYTTLWEKSAIFLGWHSLKNNGQPISNRYHVIQYYYRDATSTTTLYGAVLIDKKDNRCIEINNIKSTITSLYDGTNSNIFAVYENFIYIAITGNDGNGILNRAIIYKYNMTNRTSTVVETIPYEDISVRKLYNFFSNSVAIHNKNNSSLIYEIDSDTGEIIKNTIPIPNYNIDSIMLGDEISFYVNGTTMHIITKYNVTTVTSFVDSYAYIAYMGTISKVNNYIFCLGPASGTHHVIVFDRSGSILSNTTLDSFQIGNDLYQNAYVFEYFVDIGDAIGVPYGYVLSKTSEQAYPMSLFVKNEIEISKYFFNYIHFDRYINSSSTTYYFALLPCSSTNLASFASRTNGITSSNLTEMIVCRIKGSDIAAALTVENTIIPK